MCDCVLYHSLHCTVVLCDDVSPYSVQCKLYCCRYRALDRVAFVSVCERCVSQYMYAHWTTLQSCSASKLSACISVCEYAGEHYMSASNIILSQCSYMRVMYCCFVHVQCLKSAVVAHNLYILCALLRSQHSNMEGLQHVWRKNERQGTVLYHFKYTPVHLCA